MNFNAIEMPGTTIKIKLTGSRFIKKNISLRFRVEKYAIRSIKPFMSLDVFRSTYFAYVHPIISYGIIFWRGNLRIVKKYFKVQKRIIRIIMNLSKNASCLGNTGFNFHVYISHHLLSCYSNT